MTDRGAPADDLDGESEKQRIDRNWEEILQELRVVQTGTQILTGFLLTIPFQQRFADLDGTQLAIYLSLVGVAAIATVLAIAPVSLHRMLFRRRRKPQIVALAHGLLRGAIAAIGVALSGTTWLIFDLVAGHAAGIAAGAVTAALTVAAWFLMPLGVRARQRG